MNILLIINSANNYHLFFKKLGFLLLEKKHNIYIVTDCNYSYKKTKISDLNCKTFIFSNYFSAHRLNHKILEKYSKVNLNQALYSDYERAVEYCLWSKKKPYNFELLKSALLSFYEEIINNNQIDIVIYEQVSNTLSYFAWFVANEYKANYLGITSSRLPERFAISKSPLADFKDIDKTLKKIKKGEIKYSKEISIWAKNYIDNINHTTPDYMINNPLNNPSLLNKYLKFKKISEVFNSVVYLSFKEIQYSFQVGNPVNLRWQIFKRNIKRRVKLPFISKYYTNINLENKYILYPLHFHPESSTSILASTYVNEYEVIRNIAFNLPQGVRLFVKDHISAYGYPTLKFYNNIYHLPNVFLIPPNYPTKKLIAHSLGVITLTSTVGYEALLLNKKVFLLGTVFYQTHKNVVRIENPSNLFQLLTRELQKDTINDEQYNINYVIAYYLNTLKGKLTLSSDEADCNAENLFNIIHEYINTNI